MANLIQLNPIDKSHIGAPDYDATILFASGALTIVLLIALYLASMSAGTSAEQLATMAVFP